MIIWGWGHLRTKTYGDMEDETLCDNCNNFVHKLICRSRTYFTLFFIPIIPYNTERQLVCPICNDAAALTKEEFESKKQALQI